MRALLADPSARVRSWMGSILDRSGDLCLHLGGWCVRLRERIDPTPCDLTAEAADRILEGVMARIAQPVPVFLPTDCDRAAASLAHDLQSTLYLTQTANGPLLCVVTRRAGQA